MSWHHGDWLAFAQAVAGVLAIFGAFGVVLFQHVIHVRHADSIARCDRLRECYISAIYVTALLQNAIDCAAPLLNSIDAMRKMAVENGDMEFNSNRIDAASDALSHALHNKLPAEIITGVLSAWIALQQFCHAIHRTTVVENMKLDELHEYCQKQFSVLNYSLEVVGLSKDKWAQALGET